MTISRLNTDTLTILKKIEYKHKDSRRGSFADIKDEQNNVFRYWRNYKTIGKGTYGEIAEFEPEDTSLPKVLGKIEKPINGEYSQGINMLIEADNWFHAENYNQDTTDESTTEQNKFLFRYVGDENLSTEPHMIFMPDFSTRTNKPLKDFTYTSCTEFLGFMSFVLAKLYEFHYKTKLVHYDITENNILFDFDDNNKPVRFVDLGLARLMNENVANIVQSKTVHKESPGYFPPELNPKKKELFDPKVKTDHDTYMAGRMLARLLKYHSIDENGTKLKFIPDIEKEFLKIAHAMQADASSRTSLITACRKLYLLASLNAVLEKQDTLHELEEEISILNQALTDPVIPGIPVMLATEIPAQIEYFKSLLLYFKPKNQGLLLKSLGLANNCDSFVELHREVSSKLSNENDAEQQSIEEVEVPDTAQRLSMSL